MKIDKKNPLVLVILDGWGLAKPCKGNAICQAKTPVFDKLYKECPNTTLKASGAAVGLPTGQDGNSETGHMNIGAGRIVEQDAVHINHCIYDGTFYKNPALLTAVNHVQENNSRLHLMGLLTDGQSAHAYPDHVYALLDFVAKKGIKQVYLHLFTDGRDSAQHESIKYLEKLKNFFNNGEQVATIMGRYYAMERNKRWNITEKAYDLLTLGEAEHTAKNSEEAILSAYNRNKTDEHIEPTLIHKEGIVKDNDAVIFFNLRSDRARQLSKAFVQQDFNKKNAGSFKRKKQLKNVSFIAMTDFGPDLDHILSAFPSRDVSETLPMMLFDRKQLYISESEKYAHVTYFLNGGYSDPIGGENRIMIPSPDIPYYDKVPCMSAEVVTKTVVDNIRNDKYDFYCINYANPDMVGHTGNMKGTIKACECVDVEVGKLMKEMKKKKGVMIVTSDHGNAEEMIDLKTGEIDTNHSTNPVPFIICNKGFKLRSGGVLGSIAPTVLKLMDAPISKLMNEKPLC